MNELRAAHLCNGLGGSLWTGAILGWHSVYALDHDEWRCARVREQVHAGWWPGLRIECADLTDWQPPCLDGGVDILAAGFSCRDISAAGRGAGLGGRSTGPTYQGCLRAIDAWRPAWIMLENSPRIRTKGRAQVSADLVARGYRWRDGVLGASAPGVGAPHGRDRWFLVAVRADVADADEVGCEVRGGMDARRQPAHCHGAQAPADVMRDGLQKSLQRGWLCEADGAAIQAAARYCGAYHWNPPHADLCGVVDGMAHRNVRGDKGAWIAALGDAWVPAQAAAAWAVLGGEWRSP